MTQKALGFLEKNKNKPFFLYLPFPLPHLALQAPDEYVKKYIGQFDEKPYFGENGYAPNKYPLSTYAAMITFLDDQVGIIMEKIKKLGLDENTIIMFSSDNGATFSAGVDTKFFNSVSGLRGLKMDLYEGGIRVPFIARWPKKIKANSVSDHVSGQFDIMATLAEISGKKISNSDGISLVPELSGKKQDQQKHGFLYFEYPENGGQLAVRIGNWKGVKRNVRNNPSQNWELFDLSKDRNETTDVSAVNLQIISQINAIVKREHTHPHILDWEFIDPKVSKK
jgi:arylsulfatase A-like enzyme